MTRMNIIKAATAAAAAAVLTAPVSWAEPGGTTPQDATYYHLLTTPSRDGTVFNVTDFGLLRAQGLAVCRLMDDGVDSLDAIYQLMEAGPYAWAQARSLSSSAKVAYCPEHLSA